MHFLLLKDVKLIEAHFRKNTNLNIYSIGDLDDFFREYSTWYGINSEFDIEQIALLYKGMEPPTLIALSDKNSEKMEELLRNIKEVLPKEVYAHLSTSLINAFGEKCILKNFGKHYKMALQNKKWLIQNEDINIYRLCADDYEQIMTLYNSFYPANFFDKRMLETGKYFGYFEDLQKSKLRGVAGIHVYSEKYRVAALGNIAIDREYRGRSICKRLTSALCIDLLKTVDNIGLNVHCENHSAINCYKKIGFEIIGEYEEYLLKNDKLI